MKLPGGENAFVDIRKLRDYCLDGKHPLGKHKARVFAAALGITAEHADKLKKALLAAARSEEARPQEKDQYGTRYVVEFEMEGPLRRATVCSIWIVLAGEDRPRLLTCYVAKPEE